MYSRIVPVFGSMRPSLLASCPVHQIEPSLAARGSCGREPCVGTSHRSMRALTGPSTMHRRRALPLGEILHQVFGHRRPFLGRDRRIEVLHHAHDREPAFRRVADADAVDVVAAAAGVGEALLHRAFRPFLGGVLGMGGADLRQGEREQSERATGELVTRLIVMSVLPERGVLLCLCFVLGASLAQIGQKRYRPHARMCARVYRFERGTIGFGQLLVW